MSGPPDMDRDSVGVKREGPNLWFCNEMQPKRVHTHIAIHDACCMLSFKKPQAVPPMEGRVSKSAITEAPSTKTLESIAYIRQLLGELRQVALNEGAEMLCYLIEMAYVEAGDVQAGKRQLSIGHGDRDKSSGVTM
jgi:hypothetical protein